MKRTRTLQMAVMFGLLAISVAMVFGQAAERRDSTAVQPAGEARQPKEQTLLDMWKVGGPVMWPIGLCSVAGLALIVYGVINTRADRMLRPDLVPKLVKIVHDAGQALGFQILMISHHDVSLFERYADRIFLFSPRGDGSVEVRQIAASPAAPDQTV